MDKGKNQASDGRRDGRGTASEKSRWHPTGGEIVGESKMSEAAIRLHVEPLEEGGYVATSPDVPGLVAEGRSIVETVEIAQGLARKIAESCVEHHDPLPPALAQLLDGGKSSDFIIPVGML